MAVRLPVLATVESVVIMPIGQDRREQTAHSAQTESVPSNPAQVISGDNEAAMRRRLLDSINADGGTQWDLIPRELSNAMRKWLSSDISKEEALNLTKSYEPIFESESLRLECPELDGSMRRSLKRSDKYLQWQKFENTLESIQFKWLDMSHPMLYLYSRAATDENDPIAKAISVLLKLWAIAFRDISKHRRMNILARTDQSSLIC